MAKPRLTLGEMAAEASQAEGGACSRCGCKDWRDWPIESTYMVKAGRRRRRVCRHCGQGVIKTTERPDP